MGIKLGDISQKALKESNDTKETTNGLNLQIIHEQRLARTDNPETDVQFSFLTELRHFALLQGRFAP